MRLWKRLWSDEAGAVLTAEVVLVGTVAVLGVVVGLNQAATAVDEELKEFAGAIRSLDQSYGYVGHQSCRAWSAGSYYRQPDVQTALAELCGEGPANIALIQQQVDAQRATFLPVAPATDQTPDNQLPDPAR
jgi:hypothetical protein